MWKIILTENLLEFKGHWTIFYFILFKYVILGTLQKCIAVKKKILQFVWPQITIFLAYIFTDYSPYFSKILEERTFI